MAAPPHPRGGHCQATSIAWSFEFFGISSALSSFSQELGLRGSRITNLAKMEARCEAFACGRMHDKATFGGVASIIDCDEENVTAVTIKVTGGSDAKHSKSFARGLDGARMNAHRCMLGLPNSGRRRLLSAPLGAALAGFFAKRAGAAEECATVPETAVAERPSPQPHTEVTSLTETQLAFRNHGFLIELLRGPITPLGCHYLLNHFDIPRLDPNRLRKNARISSVFAASGGEGVRRAFRGFLCAGGRKS